MKKLGRRVTFILRRITIVSICELKRQGFTYSMKMRLIVKERKGTEGNMQMKEHIVVFCRNKSRFYMTLKNGGYICILEEGSHMECQECEI